MIEPPIQIDRAPVTRRIGAVRREPGIVFWRGCRRQGGQMHRDPSGQRPHGGPPAIDLHPFESCRQPMRRSGPRFRVGSPRLDLPVFGGGGKGAQLERARRARARQLALAPSLPVAARDQPSRQQASARERRPGATIQPGATGKDRERGIEPLRNRSALARQCTQPLVQSQQAAGRDLVPGGRPMRAPGRRNSTPKSLLIMDSREVTGSRGAVCRYGQGVQPDIPPPR